MAIPGGVRIRIAIRTPQGVVVAAPMAWLSTDGAGGEAGGFDPAVNGFDADIRETDLVEPEKIAAGQVVALGRRAVPIAAVKRAGGWMTLACRPAGGGG